MATEPRPGEAVWGPPQIAWAKDRIANLEAELAGAKSQEQQIHGIIDDHNLARVAKGRMVLPARVRMIFERWHADGIQLHKHIAELEAQAAAQEIVWNQRCAELERERDEALRRAEVAEAVAKTSDLPCGHSDQYAYSADGGKHVLCLVCVLRERDEVRRNANALADAIEGALHIMSLGTPPPGGIDEMRASLGETLQAFKGTEADTKSADGDGGAHHGAKIGDHDEW